MRLLLAAAMVLALPACSAVQRAKMTEAQMELSDAEASCRADYPNLTRQTAIPRAACIGQAEQATLVPAAEGFADLIGQRIAFRNALAARIANGELSPQQAQSQFIAFNADLARQADARAAQSKQPDDAARLAFVTGDDATPSEVQTTRPEYTPP